MNRRQPHHRFTGLGRVFVVLAQAPIPPQPGEGSLHHPTHLQRLKPRLALRPAHNLQSVRPPMQPQPRVQPVVVILVVREHHLQPRQVPARRLGEHLRGRPAVVHVGGRHHHGDQQPQRVHQDMAFAAVDLLAAVGAALLAALGRLDQLAVDGGGDWGSAPGRLGPGPARAGRRGSFARCRRRRTTGSSCRRSSRAGSRGARRARCSPRGCGRTGRRGSGAYRPGAGGPPARPRESKAR